MNKKVEISPLIKEGTLAHKFVECLLKSEEIGSKYLYICLITTRGLVNVRVDAVYPDGYMSENTYYTFSPFKTVDKNDYQSILEMEANIFSKLN